MAGNLVKWWRHKILGGYKQFSVLQDSATDSEEIIYPIRAPSSCSAPPDLLLTTSQDRLTANDALMVGHRQTLTTTNCHNSPVAGADNHQHHLHNKGAHQPTRKFKAYQQKLLLEQDEQQHQQRSSNHKTVTNAKENQRPNSGLVEETVRLEELHCDVSLDQKHHNHHHQQPQNNNNNNSKGTSGDGKSKGHQQPVQFSFTLYDLDGHGKITKDDIAGIVSTIYESLGKSVVVPHYGSKTINVRLTVSPDSTSKPTAAAMAVSKSAGAEKVSKAKNSTPRRRYRPRKLISDDEGSDTSHDLNHNNCMSPKTRLAISGHKKPTASPLKSPLKEFSVAAPVATVAPILTTPTTTDSVERNLINLKTPTNSIYMNLPDNAIYDVIKPSRLDAAKSPVCDECNNKRDELGHGESPMKHQQMVREHRKKLLRKTRPRKQKYNEVSRVRSLSVGNEHRWNRAHDLTVTNGQLIEIDGNHGGNNAHKMATAATNLNGKSDEECWRSSLRRRELIEIIRESMEKNRLCFQTANRKPLENSPVIPKHHHHRHRSHTVGKVTTLDESLVEPRNGGVPNLCGYDSYLHATICTGANSHQLNNVSTTVAPLGVVTPMRKKCNKKLIQSRLRQQFMAQQMHQQQQQLTYQQTMISPEQQMLHMARNSGGVADQQRKLRKAHRLTRSKSKEELQVTTTTKEKMNVVENLLVTDNFMDKLKISEEIAEKFVECSKSVATRQQNEMILEYASIPITADAAECENLIPKSNATTPNDDLEGHQLHHQLDTDSKQKPSPSHSTPKSVNSMVSSSSAVHRYVHEHIHHHYHHFENEENLV